MNHKQPTKKESEMIQSIEDTDEDSFLRNWSARVYDHIQLAQIAAVEEKLIEYATMAWRPMSIAPPRDVLLLTSCEDGVVLMAQNQFGEWRTSTGGPHKPPRAWMPCPVPQSR